MSDQEKDLGTQGTEDTLKGKLKQAAGKVQSAVGHATGDTSTEVKGDAKQVGGAAQSTLGNAERKVDDAVDRKHAEAEARKRYPEGYQEP